MWGPKGHQIKYTKGPFVTESSLFFPTLSKPKLRDPEGCNKERREALFENQGDHRYQQNVNSYLEKKTFLKQQVLWANILGKCCYKTKFILPIMQQAQLLRCGHQQ